MQKELKENYNRTHQNQTAENHTQKNLKIASKKAIHCRQNSCKKPKDSRTTPLKG